MIIWITDNTWIIGVRLLYSRLGLRMALWLQAKVCEHGLRLQPRLYTGSVTHSGTATEVCGLWRYTSVMPFCLTVAAAVVIADETAPPQMYQLAGVTLSGCLSATEVPWKGQSSRLLFTGCRLSEAKLRDMLRECVPPVMPTFGST